MLSQELASGSSGKQNATPAPAAKELTRRNSCPTQGFNDLDMSTLQGKQGRWGSDLGVGILRYLRRTSPMTSTHTKHLQTSAVNMHLPAKSLRHMKLSNYYESILKRRNNCLGGERRKQRAGSPRLCPRGIRNKGSNRGMKGSTCSSSTACLHGRQPHCVGED